MFARALGLIETAGLAPALEAADAMTKAANVELVGYELARGGGLVTVKIRGDVGAVKAAVGAGNAAASKVGKVVSVHVIPRPHQDTEILVNSPNTRGAKRLSPSEPSGVTVISASTLTNEDFERVSGEKEPMEPGDLPDQAGDSPVSDNERKEE